MSNPPPGYDDESVVPQSRLKNMLGNLERELETVQKVFSQSVPGERQESSADFSSAFWGLRNTAEELGSEYTFLIEKLIQDYESFKEFPDSTKLDQLFSDIKSLQLLLTG